MEKNKGYQHLTHIRWETGGHRPVQRSTSSLHNPSESVIRLLGMPVVSSLNRPEPGRGA